MKGPPIERSAGLLYVVIPIFHIKHVLTQLLITCTVITSVTPFPLVLSSPRIGERVKRHLAFVIMLVAVAGGALTAVAPAQAATPGLVAAPVIDAAIIADGVRLRSAFSTTAITARF
ncbi:hypothetical protein ACQPYK_41190 [Streptosporangium sp. CA-135522]|uniref:hypothetical protein n=1 Tax=Streptosporangium sp. CA-135522 TaxID=3240072 RepID=UPI003D93C8B0